MTTYTEEATVFKFSKTEEYFNNAWSEEVPEQIFFFFPTEE